MRMRKMNGRKKFNVCCAVPKKISIIWMYNSTSSTIPSKNNSNKKAVILNKQIYIIYDLLIHRTHVVKNIIKYKC